MASARFAGLTHFSFPGDGNVPSFNGALDDTKAAVKYIIHFFYYDFSMHIDDNLNDFCMML